MKLRPALAALAAMAVIPLAACGTDTSASTSSATSTTSTSSAVAGQDGAAPAGGRGGTVDVSSVSSEADLVTLVQEAYGDPGLGLHRGHQPIEDVLNEVLGISHDELHVRMEEQGQNLAAVATDVGIDPQTLIDALVANWQPAIDNALESGAITQAQAEAYHDALVDAFTFRVTWNGTDATPSFDGVQA